MKTNIKFPKVGDIFYWEENCGDFKCTIKEIKLTYTEEEI